MENKKTKNKVLIILGPTSVGKSGEAVKIAHLFNGEIISADSVQVYKQFDIGSAKITQDEMDNIEHYGIDILEPQQEFNVYEFINYTKEKINLITQKGKLPIIVGGTNMYVNALCKNYNLGGLGKDKEFRDKINLMIEKDGVDNVYDLLCKISPLSAKQVDKNNKQRLVRALEIAMLGGEKQQSENSEYDFLVLALVMDRAKLYDRINIRAELMIKDGLENEVKNIIKNYGTDLAGLKSIGYREMLEYLQGKMDYNLMIEKIKQHTRNYAKRQLTFLRSMDNVLFIDKDKQNYFESIVEEIKKWKN